MTSPIVKPLGTQPSKLCKTPAMQPLSCAGPCFVIPQLCNPSAVKLPSCAGPRFVIPQLFNPQVVQPRSYATLQLCHILTVTYPNCAVSYFTQAPCLKPLVMQPSAKQTPCSIPSYANPTPSYVTPQENLQSVQSPGVQIPSHACLPFSVAPHGSH